MKTISIKNRKNVVYEVLVDDEDYECLNNYKWYISKGYVVRDKTLKDPINYPRKILMHRQLLSVLTDNFYDVDHIDLNKSNNQKENLRLATRAQNIRNSDKSKNNTTGFKGVVFDKKRMLYKAQICIDNNRYTLGRFNLKVDAAKAYDIAALKYFGEFARTNFPKDKYSIQEILSFEIYNKKSYSEIKKNSPSSIKGVDFVKARNRWRARYKGKQLGYFVTEELAIEALKKYGINC